MYVCRYYWYTLATSLFAVVLLLSSTLVAAAEGQPTERAVAEDASEPLTNSAAVDESSSAEESLPAVETDPNSPENSAGLEIGCGSSHAAGEGWGCIDPAQDIEVFEQLASTETLATYSWKFERTVYYGIGPVEIGHFKWRMRVNFSGRRGYINQEAQILSGPLIRADFRVNAYYIYPSGSLEFRDGVRYIRPLAPSFGSFPKMPQWAPYFHSRHYELHYGLRWRAQGWSNPSSGDGTFGTARKNSPDFWCTDSLGNCYFP
jgi:hypothetical protein